MEPAAKKKLEAWEKSICWIETSVLVFRQGKTLLGPVKNKKTCILIINIDMNTSLKLEALK